MTVKVAVRPAMLYGLETVALTKRQEAEMEVAELKMFIVSLGVTRMDKITKQGDCGGETVWRENTRGKTGSVFARIERGQGADLGKGHFCARPIILRALLRVILHFEGTMGK